MKRDAPKMSTVRRMIGHGAERSKEAFRILKERDRVSVLEIAAATGAEPSNVRRILNNFLWLEIVDFKTVVISAKRTRAFFFLTDAAREMNTLDDVLNVQPWVYKGK